MIKNNQAAFLGLTLVLCLPAGGAAYYQPGNIYDGELVSEGSEGIAILVDECKPTKYLVKMHYYRKSASSDATCPGADGRKYKKVQIEEIASPTPPKPDSTKPDPKTGPVTDPKKDTKPGSKSESKPAPKPDSASVHEAHKQESAADHPALLSTSLLRK